MRVSREWVECLIENEGCLPDSATPPNATGVLRLALDLQDERADNARLREAIKRESKKHSPNASIECRCEICQIAREAK